MLSKNYKATIHSIDSLHLKDNNLGVQSGKELEKVKPDFKARISKNQNERAQFSVNIGGRAFSQQTARPSRKSNEEVIL